MSEPWARPAADVLAALDVDPDQGLAPAEVEARRRRHGANVLRRMARVGGWRILANQVKS